MKTFFEELLILTRTQTIICHFRGFKSSFSSLDIHLDYKRRASSPTEDTDYQAQTTMYKYTDVRTKQVCLTSALNT